jgi:hypothetical protein
VNRWREIRSAVGDEAATPLAPDEEAVRLQTELTDDGYRRVAALLDGRPDVTLWVDDRGEDLSLLRWFPDLRQLQALSLRLRSIEGVRATPSLEVLTLGDTLKTVSLAPVASLGGLRGLYVNGTWRHPEVISELTALETLGIGTIDLELLLPLTRLRSFTSGLGTIHHWERLPEVGRLERLELYRLRKIGDASPIAELTALRHLSLASISAITTIPSLARCDELRRVDLEAMKGITDLRGIADARRLRYLLLVDMPQLRPEALRPFVGHPSLRAGVFGLGSLRRNDAARDLVALPPIVGENPWYSDDLSD